MNLKKQKGFTLIELLVVIAIIGILASVVLASLGKARTKARDASAKASLSAMRAEAELAITSNGTYPSNICTVALKELITSVESNAGTVDCASSASAWAASATLGIGGSYCADSTGFSGPGARTNFSCDAFQSGPGGDGGETS